MGILIFNGDLLYMGIGTVLNYNWAQKGWNALLEDIQVLTTNLNQKYPIVIASESPSTSYQMGHYQFISVSGRVMAEKFLNL